MACLYNFKSIYIDDHKHATPLGLVVQGLVIWLLTCSPSGDGAINRNSWISGFCVSSASSAGTMGGNTCPAESAEGMRAEKRRKNTKQKRYRRSTFGVVQALLHLTFYIYHLTLKIQCFVPGITHCDFSGTIGTDT